MANSNGPRPTALGVIASVALIGILLCVGIFVVVQNANRPAPTPAAATDEAVPAEAVPEMAWELQPAQTAVARLAAPAPYVPQGNVIKVELSEYAGYAGLIAANGGLAPNPESFFQKKYGFQVQLTLSEEESWSALNSGKMAASATTADVLAVYGRQFDVVVPAQIGFSRGADGIVVRSDVKRLNDLKGKVVIASQFTEAEFFLRYLAQEAGIPVNVAEQPVPSPEAITVVFAEDAFQAGDFFLQDLEGGRKLAGCVTWEPKTSEVVEASKGQAHLLVSNRNLLVIADILIVNKGFATANPKLVQGLVDGLLEGNRMVRDNPSPDTLATVGKAFGWSPQETSEELAKVHLSNLPENLAFMKGEIDMAGSFGGIVQSAIYAYGPKLVPDPVSADRFMDLQFLEALQKEGRFANQKISIAPIRLAGGGAIETDPLLSKDIRFFFEPNSSKLDMQEPKNTENLQAIQRLLQVSPGSTVLLRGHVDDAKKEEFRKSGGDAFVRQMAMKAVELSKDRADEVERQLVATQKSDDKRLETVGIGWDQPAGTNPDLNRRVEVQWFTVE